MMTFWPRLILGCLNLLVYSFWVNVSMIGISEFSQVGPIRYQFVKRMGQFSCRAHPWIVASLWWVNYEQVEDCGYEKWLGPDWKPQWSGSGTIVMNHVCWMDITLAIAYFFPSFVAKESVKSYPGVGSIATAIDCLFLDRAGTKEDKIKMG